MFSLWNGILSYSSVLHFASSVIILYSHIILVYAAFLWTIQHAQPPCYAFGIQSQSHARGFSYRRNRATRCIGWIFFHCCTTLRKNRIWKVLQSLHNLESHAPRSSEIALFDRTYAVFCYSHRGPWTSTKYEIAVVAAATSEIAKFSHFPYNLARWSPPLFNRPDKFGKSIG